MLPLDEATSQTDGVPLLMPESKHRICLGLILTSGIAAIALIIGQAPILGIFSPMILSVILGIIFRNTIGMPVSAKAGVSFALRRILRIAIVLLGLQLTFSQVVEVGPIGVAIIIAALISTFLMTKWLGRVLGVDWRLAELIGAGTAICGASAVIAMNTVTRGHDEDATYAVASVTLFGTIAMFLYPLLSSHLPFNADLYGLWAGASIHEIAQVLGATFQVNAEAGHAGAIAKLSRVMLLAPLVMTVGFLRHRQKSINDLPGSDRAPIPWFVLGFIALAGVNSLFPLPPLVLPWVITLTSFLLSVALAGMGLEADIRTLWSKGLRPLLLAAAAWLFIAGFSLLLIWIIQ